jgi:copper resistance protein C
MVLLVRLLELMYVRGVGLFNSAALLNVAKEFIMKKILLIACAALFGVVFAHSKPSKIVPANGSSVKSISVVKITFDEAIEAGFSTFKVYPYSGALTDAAMDVFSEAKLKLKNDAATRADLKTTVLGLTTGSGTTKTIEITLKPKLKTGVYLVMWRILGTDTHGVNGNSYFRIKP